MKITDVSATNLKGRTFTVPLSNAVVIIAPNMTGKTAILDAIKLALLGHLPGLDKTNQGIFELASANTMTVGLTIDDGNRIERGWMLQPDSSVKRNERQTGLPPMPLVMLDAQDYFGRSERERAEMVFGLLNLADVPTKTRVTQLLAQLADNGRTVSALKRMQDMPKENFQRWLERAIAFVDEEKKQEVRDATAYEKTSQKLAQMQLENELPLGTPSAEALAELLGKARADLEKAREKKGEAEVVRRTHDQGYQRRLALQEEIKKLDWDNPRGAAEELSKSLKQFTKDRDKLNAKQGDKPLGDYYSEQASAAGALESIFSQLKDVDAAENELDAEIKETLKHKTCPVCASNKPTWHANATKRFDERRAALHKKRDDLTTESKKRAQASDSATAAIKDMEDRQREIAAIQKNITATETKLAKADAQAATLAAKEKELSDLGPQDAEEKDATDAKRSAAYDAECAYQDALDAVTDLEAKQSAVLGTQAREKQLQEAATARDAAKAAASALVAGGKVLEAARQNYMQSGIAPLLAVANAFADGILPSPLAYMDGQIGRIEKHRWISSRVFSGAEQEIARAALSAALGSQAPIRLVIVDELGRMDNKTKPKFIGNVLKALDTEGESGTALIDQFICADVDATIYKQINDAAVAAQQPQPLQIVELS